MFDQQKSIWAHACPPALNSVAKGFDYLLRLLTRSGIALRSDDDFLEHKLRSEIDPVGPLRIRRVVQLYEHPHLLFIAPALVLGAQEALCQIEVHIFWEANLQDVRLVEDVSVVVGPGVALRDVEAETDSGMGSAVMTPKQ